MTPQEWSPEIDRRSEARRHLLFATTVTNGDGEAQPVLVRDISARGLLLEVEDGAVLESSFHIDLPEAGAVLAHIIWQGDKLAGCRLENHLSQATIDTVKKSGEHDHTEQPEDFDVPMESPQPRTAAKTLAARLKQLRLERDLTRAELAERSGISTPSIWAWETGRTVPRLQSLETLAKGLDVPVADLQIGAGPPPSVALSGNVEGSTHAARLHELVEASKAQIAAMAGTTPERITITITL